MPNPIFKRARQRYGDTPQPVTPYQKAAQAWDERIGSARVQARNWRLAALGSLALAGALALITGAQALSPSVTPYVVELARDGEVLRVSAATPGYVPSDAQIAHHLEQFVEHVRSVSSDDVVLRRNWERAYDVVTDRAAVTLNAWASENDPFRQPRVLTTVNVQSVVRASPDSFELRWRETAHRGGIAGESATHTALLGVALIPPEDERAVQRNPLGIYIHNISWSRDRAGE